MKIIRRRIGGGFTLIELLIVLGVTVLLATFTVPNILGRKSKAELDGATTQLVALFREAQSRSVTQASGSDWGVHLENNTTPVPFYALFSGIYGSSTIANYYRLPDSVRYAPSTLPVGTSTDIIFAQITGIPNATTSVRLELISGGNTLSSSTIFINRNGLISY